MNGIKIVQKKNEIDNNTTVNASIYNKNRELNLFYDTFKNESTTKEMKESAKKFIKNINSYTKKSIPYLQKYVKEDAKNYSQSYNKYNINSFFVPKDIYVSRKDNSITLLGKYKFDPEHGLGINFNKEKIKVGPQDLFL